MGKPESPPRGPARLTPQLDVILHRPKVRGPRQNSDDRGRVLRRYPDGTLDYDGALHAVLDVLWKLRAGGVLTPVEQALASLVLPGGEDAERASPVLGPITREERDALAARIFRHLVAIAAAERAQLLARSATDWDLPSFRANLPIVLAGDPFRLGTAAIAKALSAERPSGDRVLAGPRGGVFHFSPDGHKVYERRARRASEEADQNGAPEHHAEAAVLWLKEAWLRSKQGDRAGAADALRVAQMHHTAATEAGLRTPATQWLAAHLDRLARRMPPSDSPGSAGSAATPSA